MSTKFLQGAPWHAMVELAEADGSFDLIVMGTHGRTGLKRLLIGSIAEKVVRHAPISVLVVRGNPDGPRFDHVLCPVDFATDSPRVIERAETFVGGSLDLLHVIELPLAASGDPLLTDVISDADHRATNRLEMYTAEIVARHKLPVRSETLVGHPVAVILAKLEEDRTFDLVAIGTHGRSGLHRMLLGSTAEKLVRHAPCSVLVIRARA
ncbi:MAG: universal stress protein [Deltaproteobacteria bacterium]|nr:universal stress protein [Deltaproteobacteria bacterium]